MGGRRRGFVELGNGASGEEHCAWGLSWLLEAEKRTTLSKRLGNIDRD
jgi:hypothetical protein